LSFFMSDKKTLSSKYLENDDEKENSSEEERRL
jgi:hypothetical protein